MKNEPQEIVPLISDLELYLQEYGWQYRKGVQPDGLEYLYGPMTLENGKGILVTFTIHGEFVLVSTLYLLKNVPISYSRRFLEINDRIKLVKLYSILSEETTSEKGTGSVDLNVGFELWEHSWNKDTFFAFLDMLFLGVDTVLAIVEEEEIPHDTEFIIFQKDDSK